MKIELTQSVRYKDTELNELELNLESLTGYQLIEAEENLRRQGITVNSWDMSKPYLIQIAASAMHIPVEVLKGMNAKDFMKVCNVISGFLLGVSEEELMRISSGK